MSDVRAGGWRSKGGWVLLIALFAVAVLFRPIAQAVKPEPAGVKITVWHSQRGEERKTLEALLRTFNAEHKGHVFVQPLGVPDSSFKDKLVRNIPRGSGPDLFVRPHNELGELFAEHVVAQIEPSDLPTRPSELVDTKLLDGLSVGGTLFGYPLTYKGLFQFYNTKLCPAGGLADTNQLKAWRERLPKATYPLAYDATSLFFHAPLLLGTGGRVMSADEQHFEVFQPPALSSFQWPGQWKRSGILPPEPNYNEMVRLFQAGQAATIVCGPWYHPSGQIDKQHAWAVAPLFKVNGHPTGSFVTVEAVFVSAKSKHPAEAKQVAAFIAGAVGQRARFDALGLPPVSKKQTARVLSLAPTDTKTKQFVALVKVQQEALRHGVVTSNTPQMASVWTPASDLLKNVLSGRDFAKSVKDARYVLGQVQASKPKPADWRPYGIILVVLLSLGMYMLVMRARQGIHSAAAKRASLIGFGTKSALPFLIPGLLAVIVLVFVPLTVGAGLSLYTHHAGGVFTFSGLQNFAKILLPPMERAFQSRSFYFSLGVTVLWTFTNVVLHVSIGVIMALLLRPAWNRLRTFYRVLLILPWAIPNYITALMWKGMFNAQIGAVNTLLSPFGFSNYNWFDKFLPAFTANLVTNTWLGFPFMMVITLGALQAIPSDLEEAATLDGASRWQRFWLVVFPHIRPALVPAVILGSVWTFNMFNIIYLVSGGAPNSQTDILITEAYRWAFERGQRFGYAAAYSVLIFLVLLFYSRVTERIQRA